VGPRAGLDACEKSRPHRDSILGPSSPLSFAIPIETLDPRMIDVFSDFLKAVLIRSEKIFSVWEALSFYFAFILFCHNLSNVYHIYYLCE
jgi:hypothetical protein